MSVKHTVSFISVTEFALTVSVKRTVPVISVTEFAVILSVKHTVPVINVTEFACYFNAACPPFLTLGDQCKEP